MQEERQQQGFQESFLNGAGAIPDSYASRTALVARTGLQATSLTHKVRESVWRCSKAYLINC